MFALGLLIGGLYTLLGNNILDTYFTASYAEAKTPLLIFCWAPLFIFLGMIYEKHLINTGDLQKNVYRFIIGCISNIVLCYFLIPIWYLNGAAIAVLTSHFITNILFVLFYKPYRKQILNLIVTK